MGKSSRSSWLQQSCRPDADIAVQTGASPGRRRVVSARSRETAGRRIQAAGRASVARCLRRAAGHPAVMTHRSDVTLVVPCTGDFLSASRSHAAKCSRKDDPVVFRTSSKTAHAPKMTNQRRSTCSFSIHKACRKVCKSFPR